MANKVSIINTEKDSFKNERGIKETIVKTLRILNKDNFSVEIYLMSGQKMKYLNKKFRGQNKTTTILSFKEPRNFILPTSKLRKIGEIYLNVSNVKHQASRERLLIHGLLHLFGYNHNNKNDRIRMEKKEKVLISTI